MTEVLTFLDQSASFVYGFELGMLWVYLEQRPHILSTLVHVANQAMVERIAAYHGYVADFCLSAVEGWIETRLVHVLGDDDACCQNEVEDE